MQSSGRNNNDLLENREDLFRQWVILRWLEIPHEDGAALKKVFHVWLQLFMALYGDLNERISDREKLDKLFLHFTNSVFPPAIDQYKWYESERIGHDIGLLAAMERASMEGWYIETLSRFSEIY